VAVFATGDGRAASGVTVRVDLATEWLLMGVAREQQVMTTRGTTQTTATDTRARAVGSDESGTEPRWYTAFGLTVASDLELPELLAIDRPAAPADVRIRLGTVDTAEELGDGVLRRTDAGELLSFADCRLLVREGREIVVDPSPEGTPAGVRWCLLGAGVNWLLAQRDALVVHASVVAIDGRAVAFVGPSGRGKSTTAAAFLAAGHDLLADDVAAVRLVDGADGLAPRAELIPGFAAVKLTPEAVAAVGGALERAGDSPIAEKQFYRPSSSDRTDPLPLAAVYVLDEGDAVGAEPVPAGAAVVELMRESHTVAVHDERVAAGAVLTQAAAVAGVVPVRRLVRPLTFESLPAVVDLVEADVRGDGDGDGDADADEADAEATR
jgi:hypothetical protein